MKKHKLPDGYDTEQEFLRDMRILFSGDIESDRANREAALEDSLFVAGEQWDAQMKADREWDNKPCLTVNRLPAFVAQVVGNRRLNETEIKVTPDVSGTKAIAQVRQGLIRSIEKNSRADRAYNNAHQNCVIGGLGNFGLSLEYAADDVFEQDIRINQIPNALAVVWDRMSREPTGADAQRCFVVDSMPADEYKKMYGDAPRGDMGFDETLEQAQIDDGWMTETDVRVVSYWQMVYEDRVLGLFQDGSVQDITDRPEGEWLETIELDVSGEPYVRDSKRTFAVMYLCTGNAILDGPYKLPIDRVPVFRVPGWEIDTAYSRMRFGLIRFAKDPQRMHNYWRSVIVEKLMLTPKAPWVAADTAVQGREDEWRNAHLASDTLLIYNADSGAPPRRTEPAQMESSLMQEAGMAMQDIRDVTNLHEASFGQQSNEVSGKAIVARQRVGEIGTVVYQDNLEMAIAESGRVINQLIPSVYDTKRIVKTIGRVDGEEKEEQVPINDPDNPDAVDITAGKYDVTTHTGPSYVTRRIEAQEGMLNMVNAMPDTLAVAADLIVEAQDWVGASKIASRLRKKIGVENTGEDPEDMSDADRQALEQNQAAAQEAAEIARKTQELTFAEQAARTREMEARALEAEARANKARVEAGLAPLKFELEHDKVEIEAFRAVIDAEAKEVQAEQAHIDFASDIITPTQGTA